MGPFLFNPSEFQLDFLKITLRNKSDFIKF